MMRQFRIAAGPIVLALAVPYTIAAMEAMATPRELCIAVAEV